MKTFLICIFLIALASAKPYSKGLQKRFGISWEEISSDVENILDTDFASYVGQPATSVSKTVTMDFYAKILNNFLSNYPECRDTFLIDYTTSNFYNHLVTYADGNIALVIQNTIDNNGVVVPEDFDDGLENLDEILQEPVFELVDTLEEYDLEPAWELTKELRGFINSDAAAGMTYRDAMLTATEKIVDWFHENVDKCEADESTYAAIATAMEEDANELTQTATQAVIDEQLGPYFEKMDEADVTIINASLIYAKFMRNLIWVKLQEAMQAGRDATQVAAAKSIGAVLHAGVSGRKRALKKRKEELETQQMKLLLRQLINKLDKY